MKKRARSTSGLSFVSRRRIGRSSCQYDRGGSTSCSSKEESFFPAREAETSLSGSLAGAMTSAVRFSSEMGRLSVEVMSVS